MYDQFKSALETQELIEIYMTNDPSKYFSLGRVIAVGADSAVYVSVSTAGVVDGIRFIYLKNVCRIGRDSRYIEKYKKIIEIFGRDSRLKEYDKAFPNKTCDLLSFFKYAANTRKVVSISLCGTDMYDITGLVTECKDKRVVIAELDEYGKECGMNIIDTEFVDFCSCDSEDEKIRKILQMGQ